MSENNLKIIPVKPMKNRYKDLYHPNLPKIPFALGLLGTYHSGKTTLLNNLFLSKHFWGGKKPAFEEVYFFSPSCLIDDNCRFIREHFQVFGEVKDSHLKEILSNQEEYEKKDMPRICVVYDDIVGMIERNNLIKNFISRFRHYNASLVISSQKFTALPTIMRTQLSSCCMFNGIFNEKELELIDEEWGDLYRGTLVPLYKKFANKKYSFLTLHLRRIPAEMYLNFEKKIDWKKYVGKYRKRGKYDLLEGQVDSDNDED
tara:strand:- start:7386 stop:8162 length:777 start_codon:yes stop_codon:yes gene_type:complete